MAKNPQLDANLTTLSFIELELLPIEVLHCGNREFHVFAKNSGNYYISCWHPKKDVDVAETRLLSHKTLKSVKECDLYRNKKVTGV